MQDKRVDDLPVKLKTIKVKKRYFNYLVFYTPDKQTILEQRKGKGIWEGLYQFPNIETNKEVDRNYIKSKLKQEHLSLSLYNQDTIIHKLSHQHIYTKFWIIETNKLPDTGIDISKIHTFPVPVLIQNFLTGFKV